MDHNLWSITNGYFFSFSGIFEDPGAIIQPTFKWLYFLVGIVSDGQFWIKNSSFSQIKNYETQNDEFLSTDGAWQLLCSCWCHVRELSVSNFTVERSRSWKNNSGMKTCRWFVWISVKVIILSAFNIVWSQLIWIVY